VKTYAVVSHTRLDDNTAIDFNVVKANLKKYDGILLGGDLAYLSSKDDSILTYLDRIFDLSSHSTMWALGNHDYSNISLIKKYTNKETYYSFKDGNTLFIVLDTQKDSSKIINEQLIFYNTVLDTTTNFSSVVVLTHKLIWMRDNHVFEPMIDSVSNGHLGDCNYCIQQNNFYQDLYPKLLSLKQNGKQILCIAGDIGFKCKIFEFIDSDGIIFLATGIKANQKDNYFIKLKQNKLRINYQFLPITDI